MARRIQHPDIEINEFDRSFYGNYADNSIPNAPATFICGFADKGQDFVTTSIASRTEFEDVFGIPVTEPETYFYNAVAEVVSRGGKALATKLPYDNESYGRYNFVDYGLQPNAGLSSITFDKLINQDYQAFEKLSSTIGECKLTLNHILDRLELNDVYNIDTIGKCLYCTNDLLKKYGLAGDDLENESIGTTISELRDQILSLANEIVVSSDIYGMKILDDSLTTFLDLQYLSCGSVSLEKYDDMKIGNTAQVRNKIRIVDITRARYSPGVLYAEDQQEECNCLGIIPIVITPLNAAYYQDMFASLGLKADSDAYSALSALCARLPSEGAKPAAEKRIFSCGDLSSQASITVLDGMSKDAAKHFPNIAWKDPFSIDKTCMKNVGIVVLSASQTDSSSKQFSYKILESFYGSLDRNAHDEYTNASTFIDNVVNKSSRFINVFSGFDPKLLAKTSMVSMRRQPAFTLGFNDDECKKVLSYQNSIVNGLKIVFNKNKDSNVTPIDIVVDAGISNIAQLAKSVGTDGKINFDVYNRMSDFNWRLTNNDYSAWMAVCKMFDEFCKSTRKDCMFIEDGLRTFCLTYDEKLVRDTDPSTSVKDNVIPNLKYLVGLNSNFTAGYCNWFKAVDARTGNLFWCPPSIKAAGAYVYTDIYFHPWDAPAGMIRGMLNNVVDVAFNPWKDECDALYTQAWNYAINYPLEGVVLEGQKTFQLKKTALDRINVRRLMLYIEKRIGRMAKHFLYEGNTAYLRQRLTDSVNDFLNAVKSENGLVDFIVKCDDENNTPFTIDNNELHCRVAVKPVKTIEYIVLDFIVTNQSASVAEEILR